MEVRDVGAVNFPWFDRPDCEVMDRVKHKEERFFSIRTISNRNADYWCCRWSFCNRTSSRILIDNSDTTVYDQIL